MSPLSLTHSYSGSLSTRETGLSKLGIRDKLGTSPLSLMQDLRKGGDIIFNVQLLIVCNYSETCTKQPCLGQKKVVF